MLFLFIALPLSPDRLRNVFEKSKDLWTLCVRLKIPDDKRNDAESATQYYSQSKALRKARKMIFWLDKIGETDLAETVMECAEPPVGMCIFYRPICSVSTVVMKPCRENHTQYFCRCTLLCTGHSPCTRRRVPGDRAIRVTPDHSA